MIEIQTQQFLFVNQIYISGLKCKTKRNEILYLTIRIRQTKKNF
jgi:hypothetical protein